MRYFIIFIFSLILLPELASGQEPITTDFHTDTTICWGIVPTPVLAKEISDLISKKKTILVKLDDSYPTTINSKEFEFEVRKMAIQYLPYAIIIDPDIHFQLIIKPKED